MIRLKTDLPTDARGDWFLTEFGCAIDAQRRITLPSQWRSLDYRLNRFFLLPGRDESLQMVPAPAFVELLNKLRKVSFADRQAALAMATIGSMACECPCDRQGRFSMTPQLMQHAGLSDKALLIGAVTTIQIWEPDTWAAKRPDSDACLDVLQAIQEREDNLTDIFRKVTQN